MKPIRALVAFVAALTIASGCSDSPSDPGGSGAPESGTPSDAPTPDRSLDPDTATPDASTSDAPVSDAPVSDALGEHSPDETSPPAPGDGSLGDAAPLDVTPSDGAPLDSDASSCEGSTVWNASSASFTVSNRPVMSPTSPPNAECTSDGRVYEFDAIGKTLSEVACVDFRRVTRLRRLSDGETNHIASIVLALRTFCTPSCRMGLPFQTLTVRDTAGCVQRSYDNNGCAATSPPLVAADDLAALILHLDGLLSSACETDGGSKDGGDCGDSSQICRMAQWPADAGARPAVDGGACGGNPLWRNFSSFTFRGAGFPGLPPPDGGCRGSTFDYDLSLQTKRLYQSGCIMGRTTYREVELVDSQIDAIFDLFAKMRTSCNTTCVADGLQADLTLLGCHGEPLASFHSQANPPCNMPPTEWASGALMSLSSTLSQIATESCGAPGDGESGGACRPRCKQVIR